MMTALRRELLTLLEKTPCSRPPTLRRCKSDQALLATNLPFIAVPDAVAAFCEECRALGWTVTESGGWLLLDHPVPAPESSVPDTLSGECGRLISLLVRHPHDDAPCSGEIRMIAKACEDSPDTVRRVCEELHGQWAVRLRRHEPLPGGLLPYLCFAHAICKEEQV